MKFENIRVYNFEGALRGMRNPKNSWHLSDSYFGIVNEHGFDECVNNVAKDWVASLNLNNSDLEGWEYESRVEWLQTNGIRWVNENNVECNLIGPKDMKLATALINGGSEHRKFLRQIMVSVDITAPLYWWKEFDTYKVGTTANSTSTMHKLDSKPITIDCFEIGDYAILNDEMLKVPSEGGTCHELFTLNEGIDLFIQMLENLRLKYKETGDKRFWKELVRWLPESWLQTRTVTMNYENLLSMVHQRQHHKLVEWSAQQEPGMPFANDSFIKFAHTLPYSDEFIFVSKD
jgi:hypothetical protein